MFAVFSRLNGFKCFRFLNMLAMFMHAIAFKGCVGTVRADAGRRISCHTKELNLHQQHARPNAEPNELHPCPNTLVGAIICGETES